MRDTDPAPIEAFLAKLRGDDAAHNAFLQRGADADGAAGRRRRVDAVYVGFSACGRGQAEDTHPQYQKRAGAKQTTKNFRALFQELKTVMENGDAEI